MIVNYFSRTPFRIIMEKKSYNFKIDGPVYTIPQVQRFLPSIDLFDSSFSPPLSESELIDIEASEREFASGGGRTYNNADDFINDLELSRMKFQREERNR